MTPKDKALELWWKHYNRIEHTLSEEYSPHESFITKQLSIIAVDEIIKALDEHQWQNRFVIEFYSEVKNEIEKL